MLKLLLILIICKGIASAKNGKVILTNDITEERREFENLLTDILLNSLKPFKCVAILCDDSYYNVFRESVFQKMGLYISFFVLLIEEQEDLLSPFPDTQEALLMIKKQDCQTYIILLSNAIQMIRLLRYGDRYRLLDTRVNYILLYDNRLFEKELYYIWKRIINVIFIREYSGVKKVGGEKKIIPWFELSTVPFPSPIKGVLVPRRLDIWRQNKFRNGVDLFRDKTSDLRNQSVKVATFQHIPATTKVPLSDIKTAKSLMPIGDGTMALSGIEMEILSTVSQNMNFFPDIYEPEDIEKELWGTKQSDGQYSGLFGELINSKADMGLGDFYYTPKILTMMDLTMPYSTECLTFLTPEALTDNSFKTLILPFQPLMWLGVMSLMSVGGLIFFYMAKVYDLLEAENRVEPEPKAKKLHGLVKPIGGIDPNEKYTYLKREVEMLKVDHESHGMNAFGDVFNSFLYTFSMLLMVSLPNLPKAWSMRVLTGCYWIYCLLVVVAYRASMTAILANPAPRVTIDTLEKLAAAKISVGGWTEINQDFFLTSLDPLSQEIGSRFQVINNTQDAVDRVAKGEFALFDNIYALKAASVKRQLRLDMKQASENNTVVSYDITKDRKLHIMSNCVINMPISLGLQKNSPIKPRVDKFIRRVIEAGLIKKWLDDVMQSILNAEAAPDAAKAFMTFQKFSGGLVALFLGYFISTIGFICEFLYFHKYVKKHPNYDKYTRTIIYDNSNKNE